MSTPGHGPVGQPQSGDGDVNMKKLIAVGAVSLAIFGLSAVAAAVILKVDTARLLQERGAPPAAAGIGRAEIGIVDQIEFDADRRLEEWRAAKRKRLSTYGWSDRGKNLIHIPITEAMDEVVRIAGAGGTR